MLLTAGVSATAAAGENPARMVMQIGEHAGDDQRDTLCDIPATRFSTTCLGAGDGPAQMSDDEGSFRYRVDVDRSGDDELSLQVDTQRGDGSTTSLIDRRLSLEGLDDPQAVEQLIERNTIRSELDATTQTTPISTDWWRTGAWQTVAMIGATIWYLSYDELNAEDWDYTGLYSNDPEFELRPQSEVWRNFGGWRFDDNVMYLNTPLHPMAGAGYYLLARGSNLGMWASVLVTNLTSFFWEAGIEHQEVISLNDLVLTGVGGIPLGEVYHQLGRFFRSSEPTTFNRVMSWIFATPTELHDLIDGTAPLYPGERGDFGWPTNTWHRFVLQPAMGSSVADGADSARHDAELFAEAELNRLPNYREEGDRAEWVSGPLYTQIAAQFSAGGGDVYSWGLEGALDFAGHHRQMIGESTGAGWFAGLGMAFRHYQHRFGGVLDRYGLVHLPGPVADATFMTGPADVRLRLGVYPDFSSIDSRAYPRFRDQTGRVDGRTVLDDERYYYGWGLSALTRLEVDVDPVHLHWNWDLHWARSIDTLDRYWDDEERFGADLDGYLHLTDSASTHKLSAMIQTPIPRLRTGLIGEYRGRAGTVSDGDDTWSDDIADWRGMVAGQLVY